MRGSDGQLGGYPAAEGSADDVCTLESQRVQQVEVVVHEVVYGLDLGKVVGLPEPGVIGRDDVEPPAREQPVEVEPRARPARRVQEEQWLARAGPEQMCPAPWQLEELLGRGVGAWRGRRVCHPATSVA